MLDYAFWTKTSVILGVWKALVGLYANAACVQHTALSREDVSLTLPNRCKLTTQVLSALYGKTVSCRHIPT